MHMCKPSKSIIASFFNLILLEIQNHMLDTMHINNITSFYIIYCLVVVYYEMKFFEIMSTWN